MQKDTKAKVALTRIPVTWMYQGKSNSKPPSFVRFGVGKQGTAFEGHVVAEMYFRPEQPQAVILAIPLGAPELGGEQWKSGKGAVISDVLNKTPQYVRSQFDRFLVNDQGEKIGQIEQRFNGDGRYTASLRQLDQDVVYLMQLRYTCEDKHEIRKSSQVRSHIDGLLDRLLQERLAI